MATQEIPDLLRPCPDDLYLATAPIIVKVGKPPLDFHVNQNVLVRASDFFTAALAPKWEEGKTRIVKLPDDDAASFHVYLAWLHEGHILLDADVDPQEVFLRAFRAYALGDKLLDVDFKDALTDAVATMLARVRKPAQSFSPQPVALRYLYEKTVAGCTMRRLVAHKWARIPSRDDMLSEDFPSGFLVDLCKELTAKASKKPEEVFWDAATRCAFHEHPPGVYNCYRAKRL